MAVPFPTLSQKKHLAGENGNGVVHLVGYSRSLQGARINKVNDLQFILALFTRNLNFGTIERYFGGA